MLTRKKHLWAGSDLNKVAYQQEEKVLGEILPEAFALLKETARRWAQNGEIRVTVSDRDRELAATKDFVVIEGDRAIWKSEWDAAGTAVKWDMVHYDVQFIGEQYFTKVKLPRWQPVKVKH